MYLAATGTDFAPACLLMQTVESMAQSCHALQRVPQELSKETSSQVDPQNLHVGSHAAKSRIVRAAVGAQTAPELNVVKQESLSACACFVGVRQRGSRIGFGSRGSAAGEVVSRGTFAAVSHRRVRYHRKRILLEELG